LLAGLAPNEVAMFKRLLDHLETAAVQLTGGETISPPSTEV
jgi:hypothetical protein